MKKMIISGNWKMHKTLDESVAFADELRRVLGDLDSALEVVVFPSFPSIAWVSDRLHGSSVKVGAQDVSEHEDGAFTGEVSCLMLKSVGCEYVILGHPERRENFHETDHMVNKKARLALSHGLKPIICIGELVDEPIESVEIFIREQLQDVLSDISSDEVRNVTFAYEPSWAVGSGKNPTPERVDQVHAYIRKILAEMYDENIAKDLLIQYGGSITAANVEEYVQQPNINGVLVGGASLDIPSFRKVVETAQKYTQG